MHLAALVTHLASAVTHVAAVYINVPLLRVALQCLWHGQYLVYLQIATCGMCKVS
ncbi:hypothetical protein LguiB_026068 [Lonicera macranthoides]